MRLVLAETVVICLSQEASSILPCRGGPGPSQGPTRFPDPFLARVNLPRHTRRPSLHEEDATLAGVLINSSGARVGVLAVNKR